MSARDILRLAQPAPRRFAPAVLSGWGTALSSIALLAASAWLITRASERPELMYLSAVIVAVRAFALGRGVFRYLERLTGHDAALGQLAVVRTDLVRRLVPLAPDGLGRTQRGALLSNLVDDVEQLQDLPLRVRQPVLVAGLASIASVVFTAFLSVPAALTLAACLVVAFLVAWWVGAAAGARAERQIAPLRARLADALLDELSALEVLTAFDATDASAHRIAEADDALRRAVVRRSVAQALIAGTVSVLAGAASLLALLVAGPGLAASDAPALAVVVLLPMAVFEVFGPLPLALSMRRQVRVAAARIAATVPDAAPPELPVETDPTGTAPPLGDGLRLRGVTASWPSATGAALSPVDLDVAPGERVLVTGASGVGKTTLAHVLVRFLDHGGRYRIGGTDVRTLSPDDVRQTVGLVEQHPFLFDESLRQNLLFAKDTAADDDLWDALARVGLRDWAVARGGLDIPVGERGALVSGGQAQRIALARALLRDFPVLVLDEPTAGVDPAASDALLRDLLAAARGHTIVLISHVEVPADLIDREVRLAR
ncbi:ABC transporter [Microbacterium mangrovi]|uniref:ABC transporter n=1 Tax=Microbacterium mangrovi TaxID=1348253 RepID=A0A0B2AAW5_9MICO|nr:thiol reductant ABC exporter subunit CydC [Microbacterium mangrovi]KHK98923.1 ABC transporter [Microbacterium mangrovi]